jgi:cytochrome d ubiquinol oxidase subunit II
VWIVGIVPAALTVATLPGVLSAMNAPAATAAVAVALLAGVAVIACVVRRRDAFARAAVAVESAAILAGWFGGQAPYLIPHHFTFTQAASSDAMIVAFLAATAAGFVFLIPSLALLFRVFKLPARANSEGR